MGLPVLPLGEGLALEPLRRSDAATLAPALADPDLAAWNERPSGDAGADAHRLVDDLAARGERGEAAPFLVRGGGGEPLALLSADLAGDREVAELGIWVAPGARNRGLAGQATRALARWLLANGVERVWLEIDPQNAASLRVAERCGFRYEGLLRAHCRDRRSGLRHDCRIYSLVRADLANVTVAADWHDDRVGAAHRGENPLVMARMRSGFAVIGDTQHLPGYSLLLTEDPSVNHLTDLDWERRRAFLFDLALLGEAVERACRRERLRRINYEVLGNSETILHGHVHARYEWEPPERIGGPVWRYPKTLRNDPAYAYSDAKHGKLRAAITAELRGLVEQAY